MDLKKKNIYIWQIYWSLSIYYIGVLTKKKINSNERYFMSCSYYHSHTHKISVVPPRGRLVERLNNPRDKETCINMQLHTLCQLFVIMERYKKALNTI